MRIAFISQWYDPETGSAAIPGSIVRALSCRGHDVTVVTGYPNYPTGKIYPGYRIRLLRRERCDGTEVLRIPIYPAHGSNPLKRALFFLSFMISGSTWGAWLSRSADAALVYSTSSTVGLAAVVLRRVFRVPVVLYIQDLWPDSVMASGMVKGPVGRVAWGALSWLARLGYEAADRVAVISPGMRDVLVERGVNADKIDLVYNWVDEEMFKPVAAVKGTPETFDVMYAGNLGKVQGLDVAVRAMTLLRDRPEIRLRLVGGGVAEEALKGLVTEFGLEGRVLFEGSRPLTQMASILASADLQLVCLKNLPLFRATMPSKTQAVLACALPVLISAPGDVADLVSRSRSGLAVPPEDPEGLARAIRSFADMSPDQRARFGANGRRFYERELSSSVGSERLEASLQAAKHQREGR